MSADRDKELASSLVRLAREGQDLSAHPTGEELVAYKTGRIAPEKREAFQDHLVVCDECRDLLLDLADFPELGAAQGLPKISNSQVDQAFEKTWEALSAKPPANTPQSAHPPAARLPAESLGARTSSARPSVALAAIFLCGCVGLSLWAFHLHRKVEELSGPRLNIALADVFPANTVSRSGAKPPLRRLEIPQGRENLTLILHLAEAPPAEVALTLRLEQEGQEIWSRRGLEVEPGPTASLTVTGSSLPSGRYRLLVETPGGTPLGTYDLEVLWL